MLPAICSISSLLLRILSAPVLDSASVSLRHFVGKARAFAFLALRFHPFSDVRGKLDHGDHRLAVRGKHRVVAGFQPAHRAVLAWRLIWPE